MPAWGTVKELLGGVPATEGNVVSMEPADPDRMPRAMEAIWREIMARRRVINDLEARRVAEEGNFASLSAKHQEIIARIERDVAENRRKLLDEQTRVLMMIRTLGIDIQDDEGDET